MSLNEKKLRITARSMTILRVETCPAFSLCLDVLDALERSPADFCRSYARLCSYLLTGQTLSAAFVRAVTEDDNPFARASCRQSFFQMDPYLTAAAEYDLAALTALCALSSEQLLEHAAIRFDEERELIAQLPRFPQGEPFPLTGARQLYDHYHAHGFGYFSQGVSFLVEQGRPVVVRNPDTVRLQDLKGYQRQKAQIVENTNAFLQYLPANNILLYGDKGTGKSSTIKAVVNELAPRGLKILEMRCDQLLDYPKICQAIAGSPYHFILFLDDLSFTQEDANYGMLKTIIEGGVARQPDNLLIYATSNRRHIIRESFADRQGDEVHRRDWLASSTSLSDRFGLEITFSTPDKDEYLEIIDFLAEQAGLTLPAEELHLLAERFALRKGGRSPRTAQQFIRQQSGLAGS